MNTLAPLQTTSITSIQQAFGSGATTPSALLETYIEQIERREPKISAFSSLALEQARHQAAVATQEINDGGSRGPFHGVPLGVKDMIDVAGPGYR